MCLLLADFLRESLAVGSEDRIPLGRELKLVEGFLAVERVRFGDRLQWHISSDGEENSVVQPLLLLPLVENAVTHGIAHLLDGGIVRVDVKRRGQRLEIVIENPCDRDRPRGRGGGVGLANVRGRLHAMHGDEANLAAAERGGTWRVELTLPATEAHERT
jgi:LytS/YehU family sensor histidine kinase